MQEIVILSAARTPIGAFQGAFHGLSAPRLGAGALAGAIQRAGVEPERLDQVYMGSVLTAGVGQAPARQAALAAGFPPSTGAVTVGKVCGSAMRAVMTAANDLRCGDYDLVAAGGMESMSRAPYLVPAARDGLRLGHGELTDSMIHDGLWDPYGDVHMGSCAETCVDKYGFSREEQDAYSLESYRRARAATESGVVADEIVPVEVPRRKGEPLVVDRDEEPFRVELEKISRLRPAFKKDGTVTAGNASKINDGAAALVLTTAERAAELGLSPLARLVAQASVAQEPEWFTTSPILAARKVLARAGLEAGDIDLWEVNEAFAVVAMAFLRDMDLSHDLVNVRGGAVALGHPIGCSGARILVTLLHSMRERGARRGCAAICLGGGEATAVVVESLPLLMKNLGSTGSRRRSPAIIMLLAALVLAGAGLLAAETYVVGDGARPCLNVRDLPETAGGVLACLDPGERVEMLNWGMDWAKVELADGTRGWAARQYLTPAPEAPQPAEPGPDEPQEPDEAQEPETDEAAELALSELTRITFDIPFPEERGGGSAIGSAETVETAGENIVVASGGVEFRYRDALLQAQRLEVDRSTRDVVAEGEVIFDQGPRRITGTRLEFNLDSKTGRMEDARVFADPDVYFRGSEVSMLGDDVYRVKNGVVTSCLKESPGWSFRTSSARIKIEGFARMRNTTMRVKKLPVFYLPYMVMPAKSDRAAGLLFPNFGTSQQRGSYLGLAWFQPFGPSYDATLYLDLYSEDYTGLGTEVRYLPSDTTSGRLEAYAIDDPLESDTRWKLSWDHASSDLPLGFRGVIRIRDFSDFNFFRDFERDFNNASIRRIESSGFLSGSWGAHSLNILVNENEAFYGGGQNVVGRQLPEVEYRLRSKQLGSLPIYLDLLSSINYITKEVGDVLDETYSRADLFPQVTIPLSTLPWLSVSVTGGERITWYEDTLSEDGTAFGGGSRTRSFPTANARIVGPSFSRVFEKGLGKFAKFKHIFEPQWAYIYVGEYEEQSRVPRFDEVDVLTSTNVWGYSLVNRVLAKPKDPEKDGDAREILSLAINQGFSLDDTKPLQRSQDFTQTSQEGPISAELRFNPSTNVSLEARANYFTLFGNLGSTSLSTTFGIGRHGFGVSWYTRYNPETGDEVSDQARLSANFEILPQRLTYGTQISYDVFRDFVQSTRHALIWNGQCWGLRLEYSEINRLNGIDDYDVRIALSLKNVGTFLDLTGGTRGGQF